jgi:hypothetical protein
VEGSEKGYGAAGMHIGMPGLIPGWALMLKKTAASTTPYPEMELHHDPGKRWRYENAKHNFG